MLLPLPAKETLESFCRVFQKTHTVTVGDQEDDTQKSEPLSVASGVKLLVSEVKTQPCIISSIFISFLKVTEI